jgi:hypothetical protein
MSAQTLVGFAVAALDLVNREYTLIFLFLMSLLLFLGLGALVHSLEERENRRALCALLEGDARSTPDPEDLYAPTPQPSHRTLHLQASPAIVADDAPLRRRLTASVHPAPRGF